MNSVRILSLELRVSSFDGPPRVRDETLHGMACGVEGL